MTGRLRLVPLGPLGLDPQLLPWLARRLERRLGVAVTLEPPMELRDAWFDPARGQLASTRIVDALVERHSPAGEPTPGEWVLAVTEADLFADGRNFVFGEATQGGHWAVIGLARLRDPDLHLLRRRTLTEAVHELGHLAGLPHCSRSDCVMHPSEDAHGVDRKRARCCATCRSRAGGETLDRSPPRR